MYFNQPFRRFQYLYGAIRNKLYNIHIPLFFQYVKELIITKKAILSIY